MNERLDREARAAQNELVFRALNEQIVKMTDRFRTQLSDVDIVCECANTTCAGTIRITAETFGMVKRKDGRFLVLPGHEDETLEDVLERNDGYVVVWKAVVAGGSRDGQI